MWQQHDDGAGVSWEEALDYCEDLTLGGQIDWPLPNAKELQSLADYSRSPGTTGSAAIDPMFNVTGIENEAGEMDYPYYWTSTTHVNWLGGAANAVYIAFGRAGAQRSDPKVGDPSDYPTGHVPREMRFESIIMPAVSEGASNSGFHI